MFNAAYAVGGPACTVKTVEKLTDIRINHFVVIDFNGFRKMVDALGGVEVCVPKEVNDTTGHITLPAGTYDVKGQRALDYVRVRHGISNNGDIGRMKRQQTFLASMANKAVSAGTLVNPVRLVKFLDAATKSLTTDTGALQPQQARWPGQVAQGRRPRPDPVPHRAVRALRARPEPAAVGARRRPALVPHPQRHADQQAVRRRRDHGGEAPSNPRRPSGEPSGGSSSSPSADPSQRTPRPRRRPPRTVSAPSPEGGPGGPGRGCRRSRRGWRASRGTP